MKELVGKIAVVTGGASGIGKGIAKKLLENGAEVVIADINKDKLEYAKKELEQNGKKVICKLVDVTKEDDLKKLADDTIGLYGQVNILCNNAGVGYSSGFSWENTDDEWNWIINTNLKSVIYGIRTFIPIMLKQDNECHIINTSSNAGITIGGTMAMYSVTKHGVVALSESLYNELKLINSKINVSVLCPGFVSSDILNPFIPETVEAKSSPVINENSELFFKAFYNAINNGVTTDEIGESVVNAIRNQIFYILSSETDKNLIRARLNNIIEIKNPDIVVPEELLREIEKLTQL
ncbi:SDR family NAD(P)-dependent oxidoreductase [Acetivibrio cellulolyticus]|uniref:SDR family NAD(P)-dependent oxidoreductase n=1 Tax=Acetivibrio cellulolyticus TaxID=35830 RepID=UPI0001E2FBC6|nr:SDR family NAD(P)-dependent oxidoreductase [Acetivibrio cellulolyticus]